MIKTPSGIYINQKIGRFLFIARENAGFSVEAAAKKLRYRSESLLAAYESGKIGIPCCEFARAIETYRVSLLMTHKFILELQIEVCRLRKN